MPALKPGNQAESLVSFEVVINGVDAPDNLDVIDARVSQSVLETSTASVSFAGDFDVLDMSLFDVGNAIVVKGGYDSTVTQIFDGEIVALGIEIGQRFTDAMVVTVEAMDRSHRLSSSVVPKTYLNQTASAIVSAVAQTHGLSADVTATDATLDYVLQTINDRSFISQLAEENGYEWWVDGSTLKFHPRTQTEAVALLSYGDNIISLSARASAVDAAQTVEVHGWDDAATAAIVGSATASTVDNLAIGSTAPFGSDVYQKGATNFGGTMKLVPGVVLDQAEATLRAKVIAADMQGSTMRLRGSCQGATYIAAGKWIELTDCGTRLSGLYYATDVEHVFGGGNYITYFELSGRHAVGLSGGRTGAPARTFGHVGFVIGIVTNVKDDDKSMHRIKVRFPMLPDVESQWARVVTLGGEQASGMEPRPEVDDEVLVGFEHGDLRRPFIIGSLLSKTDSYRTGAINSDGTVNKRGIRTRGGHKFEMFDGDSKSASTGRYISLLGADKATEIRLGDENMSMKTKNGNPITIESGTAKITLDNGKITITCDSMEIKATQGFKVQGMTVDLKSDTSTGLAAGTQMQIQGQATVAISSSGMTEVKGSLLKLN